MKKILKLLLFIMIFASARVYAAGSVKVSPGSINLQPGGSKNITITADNAAGRIDISSSNTSVATVSTTSQWVENGSVTVKVKAVGEGSAQIIVKLTDVASFDGKVLTGNKVVNVTSKKAVADQTDATLKELSIEGYKIDFDKKKLNYTLEVPNNITSLKVKATPSSSAAKVSIGKADDLKLGENTIKIVATAGNGTTKEYVLKVIRKDDVPEATIEQLQTVIKNTTKDTIALKLTDDTVITKEAINIIKDNSKNVIINKYGTNGKVEYSWIINNDDIKTLDTFDSAVSTEPKEIEKMQEKTNYSDGIYLELSASNMDKGTLKLNVSEHYKDDALVNVLTYKDDNLNVYQENVKVENGFVSFDADGASNYIVTRANLKENSLQANSKVNYFAIISIIELGGLIGLGGYTFMTLKKIPKIKKGK